MPAVDGAELGSVVDFGGLRRTGDGRASGAQTPSAGPTLRPDVEGSIEVISRAGSVISVLSAKMRAYETIISGLNKTIAEHRSREEKSHRRAVMAEARVKDAEERIRGLELREATALNHLDRAMKAVDTSFAFPSRLDHSARLRP